MYGRLRWPEDNAPSGAVLMPAAIAGAQRLKDLLAQNSAWSSLRAALTRWSVASPGHAGAAVTRRGFAVPQCLLANIVSRIGNRYEFCRTALCPKSRRNYEARSQDCPWSDHPTRLDAAALTQNCSGAHESRVLQLCAGQFRRRTDHTVPPDPRSTSTLHDDSFEDATPAADADRAEFRSQHSPWPGARLETQPNISDEVSISVHIRRRVHLRHTVCVVGASHRNACSPVSAPPITRACTSAVPS